MTVKYVCKHCRSSIGEIDSDVVSEWQLGFHFLTPEERKDIITYDLEGHMIVNLCCDYCQEALEAHPELNLVPNPLQ